MKKVFAAVMIVLLVSVPAFADSTHSPSAQATGGSATINAGAVQNNPRFENNIGNGFGNFSPRAEATIERGAVQNYNANIGINRQSQIQGQMQVQGQSMNNAQTIAPSQEVTIINPDPKRELPVFQTYQAPGMIEYRGPYKDGILGKAKPWKLANMWHRSVLEGMTSVWDSAKCKMYPVATRDEATENLAVKSSQDPVVAYFECSAKSDFELWGLVGTMALKAGARSIEELAYSVTFSNKASGFNLGFGGGVSVVGNGNNDHTGGSVGGGTGFGSVTTEPIEKVNAIFVAR